ncbi:hypothetical protein ACFL3H_05130 [Gemmatimonadota bacterium]
MNDRRRVIWRNRHPLLLPVLFSLTLIGTTALLFNLPDGRDE